VSMTVSGVAQLGITDKTLHDVGRGVVESWCLIVASEIEGI